MSDHVVCKNSPSSFCNICGRYVPKNQRRSLTTQIKRAYFYYFNREIQCNESWTPDVCCSTCGYNLKEWLRNSKSRSLPFSLPTIWSKPLNAADCYFCTTVIGKGYNKKNRQCIIYPNVNSVQRPVQRMNDKPPTVPVNLLPTTSTASSPLSSQPLPITCKCSSKNSFCGCITSPNSDLTNLPSQASKASFMSDLQQPQLVTQDDLNYIVRKMNLSKENSELLASWLFEKNLLHEEARITHYRKRNIELQKYFEEENDLCYVNNIEELMVALNIPYKRQDWRLFIDSSKSALKAALLHNGNILPTIPVGYSVNLKENYDTMNLLLSRLKYDEPHRNWSICGDLKVISLLMGMQLGNTSNPCYFCLWDSRDDANHYNQKVWPERTQFELGLRNVVKKPLVEVKNVILPPLHIKLGLVSNFIKALPKEEQAFKFLKTIFPAVSDAKLQQGILDGPQIRKLIGNNEFYSRLNETQSATWLSLVNVIQGFLGNEKATNYEELVQDMLVMFHRMGVHMSHKIHLLDSHLSSFPENLGAVTDETGERFHQDIKIMEKRYQGRSIKAMLADFCWFQIQEEKPGEHRRERKW